MSATAARNPANRAKRGNLPEGSKMTSQYTRGGTRRLAECVEVSVHQGTSNQLSVISHQFQNKEVAKMPRSPGSSRTLPDEERKKKGRVTVLEIAQSCRVRAGGGGRWRGGDGFDGRG